MIHKSSGFIQNSVRKPQGQVAKKNDRGLPTTKTLNGCRFTCDRLDGDNECTVMFPCDPGLLLAGAPESAS